MGERDGDLGNNEKIKFGAQAMQNCDSASGVSQTTMLVHHPFELHARLRRGLSPVMPGFMPGIHVLRPCNNKDVDGRDEPGHDELKRTASLPSWQTQCIIHSMESRTPHSFG